MILNSTCKWSLSFKQVLNSWYIGSQSLEKMVTHACCHSKGFITRDFKAWDIYEVQTLIHKILSCTLKHGSAHVAGKVMHEQADLFPIPLLQYQSLNQETQELLSFKFNIKMQTSEMCVHNLVQRQVNFVCWRINFNFVGELTLVQVN